MIHFQNDVLYTRSNEWAKKFNDVIRAGIDDYSQSSLGDIVHIEIYPEGTHVMAGKPFGTIEATKSVSEIHSPVTGVILHVNPEILESPGLVNIDPYGEGWLAEISPDNPAELDSLMTSSAYKSFIS